MNHQREQIGTEIRWINKGGDRKPQSAIESESQRASRSHGFARRSNALTRTAQNKGTKNRKRRKKDQRMRVGQVAEKLREKKENL